MDIKRRGNLFIASGPSGVGKDTVLNRALPQIPDITKTVSYTTRQARPGEEDGRDYYFVTLDKFEAMVEAGSFIEWAQVNGGFYGTPKHWVEERTAEGTDVLMKLDVQGAVAVKAKAPDAILIFLMPPSLAILEHRLRGRGTEKEEEVTRRLLDSRSELQLAPRYDYYVVVDEPVGAADRLRSIVFAERARISSLLQIPYQGGR